MMFVCIFVFCFFFKQKTAYEMRISDWSLDVCSSDLPKLRIALTRVGDVEVELIEPLGDTAAMYKDFLPGGDELSIRFHHVAVRVEGAMEIGRASCRERVCQYV